MTDLVGFLLDRITEDEARTWQLVPYSCEPGCCAPAGYVGRRCLICQTEEFGGTVTAVARLAAEHDESVHRRSRVLAECAAKRRIVELADEVGGMDQQIHNEWGDGTIKPEDDVELKLLHALAAVYCAHPDWQPEWAPTV